MATRIQLASNSITGFAQRYEKFSRDLLVKQYSLKSIISYSCRIASACLHYGKLPEELNSEDINNYLHHIITSKPETSRSLLEHTVTGLRCYYKTLGFEEHYRMLPSLKRYRKLPMVLSQGEVFSLLKAGRNVREKAIVGMLYSCGLRVSELCNLEINDINSGRMMVHVRQGKGCKDRYIPLAENILPVLRAYYKQYRPQKYLFNTIRTLPPGRKMKTREVSYILSAICNRIKQTKRVSCHTLRHSYASHLLEMGGSILNAQRYLGHSNLRSTMVYLHITLLEEKRGFSPLDKLLENQKEG